MATRYKLEVGRRMNELLDAGEQGGHLPPHPRGDCVECDAERHAALRREASRPPSTGDRVTGLVIRTWMRLEGWRHDRRQRSMTQELDWRLETREEEWMHGATLERRRFTAPSPDWDHAECGLCWEKFAEPPQEGLREGYVYSYDRDEEAASEEERTTHAEGMRIVEAPTDEVWICGTCFSDFEAYFGWTAVEPSP